MTQQMMQQITQQIVQQIYDLSCNSITIQQAQNVGSVYIISIPSGAKIYIDNVEQIGLTTPVTINNISSIPSEHTYRLTKSGYLDAEGIIFITTGETYNLTVMLCKPPTDALPILAGLIFTGLFLMLRRKEEKPKLQPILQPRKEEGLIKREGKLKLM